MKSFIQICFLSALIFLLSGVDIIAQNLRVAGVVRGNNEERLAGVTIINKETKKVVGLTDEDGKYSVIVPVNGILNFTCLGYDGQDIKVKGRQIIDVVLVSTAVKIQEVSVVAKIKNKVIIEPSEIEVVRNYFHLRTRFKVPAEMFSSNTRLIVQPTLYNITRKKGVLLKPVVTDGREYTLTQERMYEFDLKNDPLEPYIRKSEMTKNGELVAYHDSAYIENLKEDFRADIRLSLENYNRILFTDSFQIARGLVNPLRFFEYKLKAKNITDLTNLTNITDAGKTVIKNLAKGTIDMENGSYTTVSSREVDGVKTFKVDVASDGKVEEGNSGLVTGDTVSDALNKASQDTNKNLDKKANIDASNIGSNLKNADGTAASEEDQKKNAESWGKAIGTGEVKESDNRLVTGDTVAKAIKDETRVSEDGTYVKKDATAGENLKNLDDQVKKNTDNITSIKNITDNLDNNYAKTDLSNVTDEGKTTIKNLAQDAVKVVNGKNTTVTTKTETNGNISYAVNVDDSAIKDVMKEDMDKKADRDAGNLTDSDVTSWQKKLGTGESQSGDHRLISGDTLYNALKEVDGNTLMKTDGVTINIDQTGTAKTIDVRGKDGVTRTITGIATDPSDPTSAANVDYVDHRVESLNSRMTHEVSRAGAGAAALAALHPLEWDPDSKFEFALGYGHYKAANAAALGLFYRPNEDVMYNLGGTLGNGDAMMSGGVTFRFGTKGRKPKASPLAMQQPIMDQNAKIEHQDEMLKIQANKIDSLEKELLDLKRLITQK